MALSDKLTRAQYRTIIRRELLDSSARWWTDAELNNSLQAWIDYLLDNQEFLWGTATVVTSTSTLTLSTVASDIQRLDAVYFDNIRLSGRSKNDLYLWKEEWLSAGTSGIKPSIVFQNDSREVSFWPPLATSGTVVFEYPRTVTLSDDVTPVPLPAFVRYSAKPFVCYRALMRPGPNQDLKRAARYKAKFLKAHREIQSLITNFLPSRAPLLRPGGTYESDILNPATNLVGGATPSGTATTMGSFNDYTPSGTINGINTIFTLPVTPTELQLFKNGQLMIAGASADYTLSASTITFNASSIPQTGDNLIAWVYRT